MAEGRRKLALVQPSLMLRDFMTIAALSGMLVEAIAKLTVEDVTNGYFGIHMAKTKAGIREVPIYPAPSEITTRRTDKRKPKDTLWPELPEPKLGSPIEKSQKVVKEFVTYRRQVGALTERKERASQYCSIEYQAELRKHGIQILMSGKGNCFDNAVAETFFKTLKVRIGLAHGVPGQS